MCSAVLGAQGHEVLEAADGREGLARATSDEPDLALLDVNMPLLDGYELAAALRQGERTRHLPFVFVTGEPEPEAGRKAKRVAQPATLGPFYSYAPPRMGARLGDGEELKKCA